MIKVIKASLLHNIFNNACHVVYHVTSRKSIYTFTLYTNLLDSSSVLQVEILRFAANSP